MTKTGFGEHLKREREMRGISLDEICAATRIGTRFLEALETEEWDRLPGGVFNRGFVRAVARYLGLDEEGMVAEYVMAMNQGSATPASSNQPETPQGLKTTKWLPWIAVTIAVLLVAAGWLGWRFYSARSAQSNAAQPAGSIPAGAPVSLPPAFASPANPLPPTPPDASAASDGMDSPAADRLTLKIEAGKATSITVTADGHVVFAGSFLAGQSHTFEAGSRFDVAAEDAGALLLQLNGKTLAPIGPPGQSGKVTLTRATQQSVAGGTN